MLLLITARLDANTVFPYTLFDVSIVMLEANTLTFEEKPAALDADKEIGYKSLLMLVAKLDAYTLTFDENMLAGNRTLLEATAKLEAKIDVG